MATQQISTHPASRQAAAWILFAALLLSAGLLLSGIAPGIKPPAVESDLVKQPLAFIPETSAEAGGVRYSVLGEGGRIGLASGGLRLEAPADAGGTSRTIAVDFLGADPGAHLEPQEQRPGVVNRYQGNDPEDWQAGLPTYGAVLYQALYPGIDLRYTGETGRLKSTFTIAPGASPAAIRWRYQGAEQVALDAAGNLTATAAGLSLVEGSPVAWQVSGGTRIPVEAAYFLDGDEAGFRLGAYDPALPLVIDPDILFETVVDLAEFDYGVDIAVDAWGSAAVAAYAFSSGGTGNDVLAAKFDPEGNLVWASQVSGNALDYNTSIALDADGNAYLTGWTTSTDFPEVNPLQSGKNGPGDLFLVKFAAQDGSLLFSTYLGGSRGERGWDLVVGSGGGLYVTGRTDSTDFPVTPDAIQPDLTLLNCFCADAFVLRLNPGLDQIVYATYLGGGFTDEGATIGLDDAGNIFLSGSTQSDDFPLVAPIQAAAPGGETDLFAAKIAADGSTLLYSTYLGGSDWDYVTGSAVDAAGSQHLVGWTRSANFPTTPGAFQPDFAGGLNDCGSPPFDPLHNCEDLFVTRILPDGSGFVFSTFLGGQEEDLGHAIDLDSAGNVYVAGYSYSPDYPPGGNPNFVSIVLSGLSADGSSILFSEYLWSPTATSFHGLAVDGNNDLYLTGAQNAPSDLFLIKFDGETPPPPVFRLYFPAAVRD